ncbi:hypothetical protein LTR56_024079 [Elasticomyces elasticus]|nr:hypothetical protein LTR56_024079 [Elasticomyces elasticus]KAK3662797.1 hypothetical protein LTR22_006413 [Elasticomyces elasticus]KAK5746297.1 hypothetical protein LTS12_022777 [Elasticomyces elasticus]
MPPKVNDGVAGYVKNRNPPGGSVDLSDLKLPVPNKPNSSNKMRNGDRQTRAVTRGNSQQSRERRQEAPGEPNAFYDTDASGIDDTSTTASVPLTQRAAPAVQSAAQQAQAQASQEDFLASDEEFATDSDEDENLPQNPQGPSGSQKKEARSHAAIGSRGRQPDGNALGRMKGDSYPSTTEGTFSVSDIAERLHPELRPAPPGLEAHSNESSHYPSPPGTHALNQPQRRQSGDNRHHQQSQQQNNLLQHTVSAQPPLEDIATGFAFAKPPQARPNTLQPGAKAQTKSQPQAPTTVPSSTAQHTASTNAADAGSANHSRGQITPPPPERKVGRNKSSNDTVRPTQYADPARAANVEPLRTERLGQYQQQRPMQPPQYEQMTPEGFSDGAVQHKQEEEDEVPVLDYELPALYKMEYSELKAATFDVDPNSNAAPVEGQSLEEKMQNASSLQPKLQASFFTTLDIGQWEQAGDWFLARFGDIMGQLKRARQEKRKAAREFEDEIEKRHNAIDKKRKFTDDALGDMKMSGGKVLQGTPKKAKKTQ